MAPPAFPGASSGAPGGAAATSAGARATDASSAPALPWATTSTERPSAPPPAVAPTSAEPRPATASPFDALVGAEQPVRARSGAQASPEADDDDWEEPESSYTWLHYIVLVVVAFVLGLLLWKLLLGGDEPEPFEANTASTAGTSSILTHLPEGAA
ncbi:hypothetical protein LEP48_10110 [Isoptericola sp. NEAU-Y5]|uniref:Uncharacterized protein n=1 Tax=Isoptericola luteus TaxID=2879484 RepID=A0ABS7ZF98_9MICO|nr:hypothetical protein [Isoptericola sp. NEAU-Y5]